MAYDNLVNAFYDLPRWWSDHAYQSIHIDVMDPKRHASIYSVSTGTWNLQDRCHSKESHVSKAFHNNPFDYDEPPDFFFARKMAQITRLEEKIREGGDDIVFLQEIDFLIISSRQNQVLYNEFCVMLARHGYNFVLTARPQPGMPSQQPLATIYNARRLELLIDAGCASRGVFETHANSKAQFRGMETTFRILDAGPLFNKMLVATNLHLRFDVDYRAYIDAYQRYMQAKDVLHVMGGDTNNVQNERIINAIGDQSFATNFTHTEETLPKLTIIHQNFVKKAYDNFFMVPFKQYYATARFSSQRSELVEIDHRGFAVFKPNLSTYVATTRVGERWSGEDLGQVSTTTTPSPQASVFASPLSHSPTGVPSPLKTQKQVDAENHFNQLLLEILSKQQKFKKDGCVDAEKAAEKLYTTLNDAGIGYFAQNDQSQADYQRFAKTCNVGIENARDTLQHHRGWKDFIAKTALTLVCVIIPLALAMVSRYNTGAWNFRLFATDSSKKLDALQKSINEMAPSP